MKSLLQKIAEEQGAGPHISIRAAEQPDTTARLAAYDSSTAAPRVIDLTSSNYEEFINLVSTKAYQLSQEKGGIIPFTAINEVVENLIHAGFNEAVVTILDDGNTIKISDQGPGIKKKENVFLLGFTTATSSMKKIIKGVGSGLRIAKDTLSSFGGDVTIEDNLQRGTVVTLRAPLNKGDAVAEPSKQDDQISQPLNEIRLTDRQKRTLFLVTELGKAGPSKIAAELNISLSTAYRDLAYLENLNLVQSDEQGKRSLTTEGITQLDNILYSQN